MAVTALTSSRSITASHMGVSLNDQSGMYAREETGMADKRKGIGQLASQ